MFNCVKDVVKYQILPFLFSLLKFFLFCPFIRLVCDNNMNQALNTYLLL